MADAGQTIRRIIVKQLGVRDTEITINASFVDDFGADERDVTLLVMSLEEAFQIELPDDAAKSIRTVRDVVERFARRPAAG